MNLSPRQQVTIYVDPIKQAIVEGTAVLLCKRKNGNDNSQFWDVRFIGEAETFGRWIYPQTKGVDHGKVESSR